jgi:hypothetical protein
LGTGAARVKVAVAATKSVKNEVVKCIVVVEKKEKKKLKFESKK